MTIGGKAATVGEWERSHRPIVVAVDGSGRDRSAVAWAAHQAPASACAVELVTALPPWVSAVRGGVRRHPHRLAALQQARDDVAREVRDQRVDTHAVPGTPLEVLLQHADNARLVVVGRRGLRGATRLLAGSTSIAVAGRSPVPVAVVPEHWDARRHEGWPIVLGVDPFEDDHRPIHLAFRRATELAVPLVAVHGREAATVPSWGDDVVTGPGTGPGREAEDRFAALLAGWAERYPDVVVRPMRTRQNAADAVLDAAEHAQLIVLGRHRNGLAGGLTLGSVTRGVLHGARCPVIVVPTGTERPATDEAAARHR